jgi:hypothetical protein
MLTTRSITPHVKPQVLVGELLNDYTCWLAGTAAAGRTPVLIACRELLARGTNPHAAVEIYRRGVLALRIRTLAAGARLTVEECSDGRPRFRPFRPWASEGSPGIAQSANPVGGEAVS